MDEPPQVAKTKPSGRWMLTLGSLLLIVCLVIAAGVAWSLAQVERSLQGISQREVVLNVDFNRFRKLMVRKDATAAITAYTGVQLVDQQLQRVEIERPRQPQPLRSALRGESDTDLTASKQLIVALNDPELQADRVSLTQNAAVEDDSLIVTTTANQPAGKLEAYETRLWARDQDGATRLTVSIDMRIRATVPKFWANQAEARVQQAAEEATDAQLAAIKAFVSEHQSELIVLPEI